MDRKRALEIVALNARLTELRRLPAPQALEEAAARRAEIEEIRRRFQLLRATR